MGLEKIGKIIGKEVIAWTRTSASKSLLATKPVKINTTGLRLAPKLEGDVVQISTKVKSPETYIDMIEHFSTKHPQNKELVKNLAIKGVEAHPTDIRLINIKDSIIDDSAIYMKDLSRSISLKPTADSYLLRYEALMDKGRTKEALNDLKKGIEYAKKEKMEPEFIAELENLLGSNNSNIARKLKPLKLTKEQEQFNAKVDEYWNKSQKEINDIFEEKRYFSISNANSTQVETSAKNHLLNSIKQIGKAEDFGLTKNQKLYHGTDSESYNLINTYGFDLNKCGRTESGKGAYFGFDMQSVREAYGSNVVVARFTGENIAKVEPGVYDTIAGSGGVTPFKINLADRLGLDICKDKDIKIIDEIISKYYNSILESKGIQGIITDRSFNAGMPYFMVPNPSKYIEIL